MSTIRALFLPLACLLASLIVGATLVLPRVAALNATRRAVQAAEQAQRMAAAAAEVRPPVTPDLERRYGELVAAGVWDSAVRAHLRDTLHDARVTERLDPLDYQIGVRQPAAGVDADPGTLVVYRTPLRVKATVLHEAALLEALTTLTARHGGLMQIDECRLRRNAEHAADTPGLSVECQLTAYSAALRDEARP